MLNNTLLKVCSPGGSGRRVFSPSFLSPSAEQTLSSTIFLCPRFPLFSHTCQNPFPRSRPLIVHSSRKLHARITAVRPYDIPFRIPQEVFVPTLDKTESSRINGARSRGPVTPAGKQRSSLNAVRHGLLAKSVCLTNENPEGFKEILQDFLTRLQPADDVEL